MTGVPSGLVEDLELERHAAAELDASAAHYFAAGTPSGRRVALAERRFAGQARARIAELEHELARANVTTTPR